MKLIQFFTFTASISLTCFPAWAGDVVGRVLSPVKESVVWLEGVNKPLNSAAKTVSQHNRTFSPSFMVVTVGQTINMLNDDTIAHNVFSQSPAKIFNLGIYPKGQSKAVKFDKTGVIDLRCTIHSNMRGVVVVVPNTFFSQPIANGSFSIKNVPPGKYILKYWSAKGQKQKNIVVGSGQTKVDF